MEKGLFKSSYEYVLRNSSNEFNCIPFINLQRLSEYIPGIIPGTYYLGGGYSSDGKTNTMDSIFVYDVYDFYKSVKGKIDIKIDWIYFSYEVVKNSKAIKATSRRMFLNTGMIHDLYYLSGFRKNKPTPEVLKLYDETIKYYEEFEDMLTIYDTPLNPTGCNRIVKKFAEDNGKVTYKVVNNGEQDIKIFDSYTPNHPNHYVIIVIDHLSLSVLEQHFNTKETIDKLSQYAVQWRNRYNFIPVFIQQFSADTLAIERHKLGKLEPDLNSFGDSKYTPRDANVVMGLFNPFKHEKTEHRKYDITRLKDNYRWLSILKTRDGMANIGVGLYFNGAVNFVKELPKSELMSDSIYNQIIKGGYK